MLPADAQRLHRVLGVTVLKDHALLDRLVDTLQLVNLRLVRVHGLLVVLQLDQLILERAGAAHADGRHGRHLLLDPWSHLVSLLSELPAQGLVVLLATHLVLECLVTLRHQRLAHVRPLLRQHLPNARPAERQGIGNSLLEFWSTSTSRSFSALGYD